MNGQQTYNRDTFIVQMTLGELLDAIDAHLAGVLQQVEQQAASEGEGYVYGIIGLANVLGCSRNTAQRIKSSGVIDKAITQIGRVIAIDVKKAMQLIQESDEQRKTFKNPRRRTTKKSK